MFVKPAETSDWRIPKPAAGLWEVTVAAQRLILPSISGSAAHRHSSEFTETSKKVVLMNGARGQTATTKAFKEKAVKGWR